MNAEPKESDDDQKKQAIVKAWQFCKRQSKSVEVYYIQEHGWKEDSNTSSCLLYI